MAFAALIGGALLVASPDTLTGEAGAGCAGGQLADGEMARAEGRYLVMETMVALALGLEQADHYIELAAPLATQGATGVENASEDNCYAAELIESEQLGGAVRVDFRDCPNETGTIELSVGAELPQGLPDGLPDDVAREELPPGSVVYGLSMQDTVRYGVLLEGLMGIEQTPESESLRTDLSFDFLDYTGNLAVAGPVERTETTTSVTMVGTFSSVGGLDWEVQGSNLVVADGCKGLKSGRLEAHFSNEQVVDVTVVAEFDGSCDGCASVQIDGVEKPRVCIPEELALP